MPDQTPQETKCPHGATLVDGKGCSQPCLNTKCKHQCSEHAMNCLHVNGTVNGKTDYCFCVGLSY